MRSRVPRTSQVEDRRRRRRLAIWYGWSTWACHRLFGISRESTEARIWRRTWVDPLHPIWVSIVVAHSKTGISDYVWWEVGAVEACDGAVRVEVVASPARICDDSVRGNEGGKEGEKCDGRRE